MMNQKATRTLHLDFETRSVVDLRACGVYRYAEDKSTSVLCAAYAFDEEEPLLWKAGESCPPQIMDHVERRGLIYSHNATFERILMRHCLPSWPQPKLQQWRCTAAMAACLSLPRDLDRAARAAGLSILKDDRGKRVMLKMCQPRQVYPNGTIIWWDDTKDFETLYEYCKQDVRVERALTKKLRPLTDREQKVWLLDQLINERGVCVDRAGVQNAKIITAAVTAELNLEIAKLTDGYVSAISQAEGIKNWCEARGAKMETIDKVALADALKDNTLDKTVRRVLEIRQEGAKSSTAKLKAYQNRCSLDGRMRDNLMYYGANTGRWAGRGAQLQNLPRSKIQDIPEAIDMMKFRDAKRLSLFYGPPLDVVSDCLRGFVIAPAGKRLIAADYSNIEGRVLAWLAGHDAKVAAFASGAKIYEELAAAVYGIPASTIKKGMIERHVGKEGELGSGYGMGWERFIKQCAKSGLTIGEDIARRTIDVWRAKNKIIVDYWDYLNDAAMTAVTFPGRKVIVEGSAGKPREVSFAVAGNILWCRLPSGRFLTYPDPKIMPRETPWGEMRNAVTYMTINNLTNQWERDSTYGGKLAENVTSGTARDVMVEGMIGCELAGYPIILTVHDEIVTEVDENFGSLQEVEAIMCTVPQFVPGLPIMVEGFEAKRYRK